MKGSTVEVQTQKLTLDGDKVADQINIFFEKLQRDPMAVQQHLKDLYFHGVIEGAAMCGHRVKSITARDKERSND